MPVPIKESAAGARRIVVVGGGAAGVFAAITAAEAATDCDVLVLERGPELLAKVRISGGGRCNVTHACFDPSRLVESYPRGARELLGPFHRFQPRDTIRWFESRGVRLKTESDGRVFPLSDSASTIVDCLLRAAEEAGVRCRTRLGVDSAEARDGGFELALGDGSRIACDKLLVATGGCRSRASRDLVEALGHFLEPPVPSLFSFHVAAPWLQRLAGVTLVEVEIGLSGTKWRERGPLLVTHQGVSGPAVLRLSARAARLLAARDYRFDLRVHWLPTRREERIRAVLRERRKTMPKRQVSTSPISPLPARLWAALTATAGVDPERRWHALSRVEERDLAGVLCATVLTVSGKTLNKDEFVTCGGVQLGDVSFKTMESRLRPGLHFAGEVLDVDGLTGGFNFQAAWTTGWIAGRAMAGAPAQAPSVE